MKKSALISGVTGQDGSYLSDLLLEKDYIVHGIHRRSSTNTFERINHLLNHENFHLVELDITDATGVNRIISNIKPNECYNLAAQSHVGTSFVEPVATFNIDTLGVINFLEAVKQNSPETKFYQASTSELYGNINVSPQNEETIFNPTSPYATAKLAAHHMVNIYREAYDIYACAGILFNHESPRRGENFVTRKVTQYVAQVYKTFINSVQNIVDDLDTIGTLRNVIVNPYEMYSPLKLGNLDAKRDFGYAKEYVEAMWLMLQQDEPEDFVIATGETHSIKELLDVAFAHIGIDDWNNYVEIDEQFKRPVDVHNLCGDASKAKQKLGWTPKVKFKELIELMVDADATCG